MKIAVRFGDNDFGNTFYAILRHIYAAFKHHDGKFTKDKDHLAFIINELAPICYLTHQNHFEYNGLQNANGNVATNAEFKHTKKYLQVIKPEDIYIDKEVDDYIVKCDGWDNGETFILDTTVFNNNVYSL